MKPKINNDAEDKQKMYCRPPCQRKAVKKYLSSANGWMPKFLCNSALLSVKFRSNRPRRDRWSPLCPLSLEDPSFAASEDIAPSLRRWECRCKTVSQASNWGLTRRDLRPPHRCCDGNAWSGDLSEVVKVLSQAELVNSVHSSMPWNEVS